MEKFGTGRMGARTAEAGKDLGLQAHMSRVYGMMSISVALTGLTGWAIGSSPELLSYVLDVSTGQATLLGFVAMFSPLVMILVMGFGMARISGPVMQFLLFAMSVLMGVSMSSIFHVYTGASIAQTFLVSAGAFAGLSIYGYTTKRDLSGFGAFLIMGLIGLILASIVNIFLQSSAMDFALTIIALFIFAGLTAHDTQNAKNIYLQHRSAASDDLLKLAAWSALDLYLDFINLFMQLLKLMGEKK